MGEATAETGAKPRILVFDSGLGGLTVFRAIRAALPGADYRYLADDARFPYGALAPDELIAGVLDVIGEALADFPVDCVVIACNTASTLVLPALRARFSMPIVGTVPAIKPAAAATTSGLISVLATPGTVSRDYTAELIRDFASGVAVTLVGSKALAGLAESALRGETVPDADILTEIAPCFVEQDGRRTDQIVLACTHYPLLLDRLQVLAPWPVAWIDPAPAIARRVVQVLAREAPGEGGVTFCMTAGQSTETALALSLIGEPIGLSARDFSSFAAKLPITSVLSIVDQCQHNGRALPPHYSTELTQLVRSQPPHAMLSLFYDWLVAQGDPIDLDNETFWAFVFNFQHAPECAVFQTADQWTRSSSSAVRAAGIAVLAQLGRTAGTDRRAMPFHDQTVPVIDRLLDDEDPAVLQCALSAAGHHVAGDLSKFDRLRHHPDASIRLKVALALGEREEPRAESFLLDLMEDSDSMVRDWATFGIARGDRDSPKVRHALSARLKDPDDEVRAEALSGLCRFGHEDIEGLIAHELDQESVSLNVLDLVANKPSRRFVAPLLRLKLRSTDARLLAAIDDALAECRAL